MVFNVLQLTSKLANLFVWSLVQHIKMQVMSMLPVAACKAAVWILVSRCVGNNANIHLFIIPYIRDT